MAVDIDVDVDWQSSPDPGSTRVERGSMSAVGRAGIRARHAVDIDVDVDWQSTAARSTRRRFDMGVDCLYRLHCKHQTTTDCEAIMNATPTASRPWDTPEFNPAGHNGGWMVTLRCSCGWQYRFEAVDVEQAIQAHEDHVDSQYVFAGPNRHDGSMSWTPLS